MSSINFANPWLLLLALPLALLILVPFFIAIRKDNRNVHNVLSCILHLLIVVCVSFSAAGSTMKTVVTETDVYVVADLSYSTHKNLDTVDRYITKLEKNLPQGAKLGVVCFGGSDAQVVHTRLGEKVKSVKGAVDKVNAAQLDKNGNAVGCSATDIVSALEYTGKIFKSDVVKRIVLITDAKQSSEEDGSLKRAVDALHTAKVYVDAIYLDSNLAANSEEVQISSVELSYEVYEGQESSAEIFLQSGVETRANLRLMRDGELVYTENNVVISKGISSRSLSLKTDVSGEYAYTVTIEGVQKDGNPYNNEYTFLQRVASSPRKLFITSDTEDEVIAKTDLGVAEEDVYFIEQGKSEVEKTEVPYTLEQLCEYDEIILSNVNIADIKNFVSFVYNLDAAVSVLGKSLLGVGNLHLESVGQVGSSSNDSLEMEAKTKLANMLPVRYGDPAMSARTYVLAFDLSQSMIMNDRVELAVAAAGTLIDSFRSKDRVAIVGFHGDASTVHALTSGENKAELKAALQEVVDNEDLHHGTVISGGLLGAKELLGGEIGTGKQLQVCLITDAANAASDWTKLKTEVDALYQAGVTTSALGIAPDGYNGEQLQNLLNEYKTKNGPELYQLVEDYNSLNNLSGMVTGTAVDTYQSGLTVAKIHQKYDEVLEGISGVSAIRGYVVGAEKTDATTVLKASYAPKDDEERAPFDIPVYAYRKCGDGKTAALMTSFSGAKYYWNKMTADDGESTVYGKFVENVLKVNVPKERVSAPFVTNVRRQGGKVSVEVRPAQPKMDASLSLAILLPDGSRSDLGQLTLESNVYSYTFTTSSVGEYTIELTYSYVGSYTVSTSTYLSYLPEYDSFTTFDASPLYKMLGSNGTVSEDGNLDIVNDEDEVGIRIFDFTLPLLIAAVSLFAIDVLVRKVKWADVKGLFFKVKKKEGKK